jgi:hypothetical protein
LLTIPSIIDSTIVIYQPCPPFHKSQNNQGRKGNCIAITAI